MSDDRAEKLNTIKNQLHEGLEDQIRSYEEMLELSQKQMELIKKQEISSLNKLVHAKNKILKKIEEAEQNVLPILKRWQDIRSEFSDETIEEVETKFRTAKSLLSDIIDLESEMEEYARELLDETSERIEELVRAEGAQESYNDSRTSSTDSVIDRNE